MNALDVLRYGHQTVLQTIDGMPDDEWETPNVCGVWSSKDIVSHLASFELAHVEVLNGLLGKNDGPEYDLEDFIVYTSYGHKREHCAQIKLFRKRLGQ